MRVFEEAVLKRLFFTTQGRAHYAGKQANASIEQHQSAHFPPGKHDIAHRNLLNLRSRLEQTLVKPFESPAKNRDAGASGEFADAGLGDGFAPWCHGEDGGSLKPLPFRGGVGVGTV